MLQLILKTNVSTTCISDLHCIHLSLYLVWYSKKRKKRLEKVKGKKKIRKGFNLKVQPFSNLAITERPYSREVLVKCFAMSMRYS